MNSQLSPTYYVRHPDDTYTEANPQPVDTTAPSPCGHKFQDGTPHPMACWNFVQDSPQVSYHGDAKKLGHCLVCASEQKLRAELKTAREGWHDAGMDCQELECDLAALREGLAGLVEKWRAFKFNPPDLDKFPATIGSIEGIHACAEELSRLLAPPAASGRESGEGQKS